MVLFAMLVVVVLGTIGLVIELGIVRLNRDRMQGAADSTALEILRERDYVPAGANLPTDEARDHGRRERNRHFASWAFDSGAPRTDYVADPAGAGPYLPLNATQGTVGNPIGAGLVVGEVQHSVPVLRTNYSGQPGPGSAAINDRRGDIVAGRFTGHDDAAPVGFNENPMRRESPDYDRVDFAPPLDPGDAPYADAVLVRLRKTRPFVDDGTSPWNDDIANISSTGYTWPLVFGLGSTFFGQDPASGYSIRHHGLAMRATAIAQARPAVRIGAPSADPEVPEEWRVGAGPLVFRWGEWVNGVTFLDDGSGVWSTVLRLRPPDYELVSIDHDSNVVGYLHPKKGAQVGDLIEPKALMFEDLNNNGVDDHLEPEFWEIEECYVPLFLFSPPAEGRVCGFVRVSIEAVDPPDNCSFPQCQAGDIWMRLTKLPNQMSPGEPFVAPRNASATFDGSQPSEVFPLSFRTWKHLLECLLSEASGSEQPQYYYESRLYAPAHVR